MDPQLQHRLRLVGIEPNPNYLDCLDSCVLRLRELEASKSSLRTSSYSTTERTEHLAAKVEDSRQELDQRMRETATYRAQVQREESQVRLLEDMLKMEREADSKERGHDKPLGISELEARIETLREEATHLERELGKIIKNLN